MEPKQLNYSLADTLLTPLTYAVLFAGIAVASYFLLQEIYEYIKSKVGK